MSSYLIDGCSLVAGFACVKKGYFITDSWPKFLSRSVSNIGYQGKDNHGIFQDVLYALDNIGKETTVIVYWSYTDRHSYYITEDERVVRSVSKNESRCIYEKGDKKLLYSYTNQSLSYMYALQAILEARGFNYYFITAFPYQIYKESTKHHFNDSDYTTMLNNINMDRVLNWDTTPFKSYGLRADLWLYSLPVLFGAKYDCLNYDGTHLTEAGERLFAEWVSDCINNGKRIPEWDISKVFAWAASNNTNKHIHPFVGSGINAALRYAESTTNYIYEGP